jgi:hypothetical protein
MLEVADEERKPGEQGERTAEEMAGGMPSEYPLFLPSLRCWGGRGTCTSWSWMPIS